MVYYIGLPKKIKICTFVNKILNIFTTKRYRTFNIDIKIVCAKLNTNF